jgi:glutamate synthase (NADPH/NADH) large chain
MTGGMAFVYDEHGDFARHANPESIIWQRLASPYWEARLKSLIAEHAVATDSRWANGLLDDWDRTRGSFWQICPREMIERLEHPLGGVEETMVAAE